MTVMFVFVHCYCCYQSKNSFIFANLVVKYNFWITLCYSWVQVKKIHFLCSKQSVYFTTRSGQVKYTRNIITDQNMLWSIQKVKPNGLPELIVLLAQGDKQGINQQIFKGKSISRKTMHHQLNKILGLWMLRTCKLFCFITLCSKVWISDAHAKGGCVISVWLKDWACLFWGPNAKSVSGDKVQIATSVNMSEARTQPADIFGGCAKWLQLVVPNN